MSKYNFSDDQKEKMANWRKGHISTSEKGFQNGIDYNHIIPRRLWEETLWEEIQISLPKYLKEYGITAHTGTHNLVSSWIACANLYFPVHENSSLRHLMLKFLQENISDQIIEITDVQLEFAFPKGDILHPSFLLGEMDGSRGSGQTSPDLAFLVKTNKGKGLILTECKYTEHSFYGCSARKIDKKRNRINNPDPNRCMMKVTDGDYTSVCHQTVWGRKYLSLIKLSNTAINTLTRCPAATGGYQILRQQALAEGIAKSGKYSLVASTVAFDERNTDLKGCLKTTGIDNFQTGWGNLFEGKAFFNTWTHQEWVKFVRENQKNGEFSHWIDYLNKRYNY